jgi:hypothetical protein
MTTSDYIAILAIILSAGAFSLELRRWLETRPRLVLSVVPDAVILPDNDGRQRLALFVINRGTVPTQLTSFVVYFYRSKWHRALRKPSLSAVVNPESEDMSSQIPTFLGTNEKWTGLLCYDQRTIQARDRKQLFVGVFASHSDMPMLIRVPRSRSAARQQLTPLEIER